MRQVIIPLLLLCACGSAPSGGKSEDKQAAVGAPEMSAVRVLSTFHHPKDSYTQGLLVDGGKFYESTGQYGQSALRVVDIATGKVEREVRLPSHYFGEGLALLKGSLYQLTWMEGVCLVYDSQTLRQTGLFRYSGEGWGLVAHNGELYMSDGTSTIRVVDPANFQTRRTIQVRDNNGAVSLLNELEMVDGMLWANVYLSDKIAVIDPASGDVKRYIDCSLLGGSIGNKASSDVLNGIAFDSTQNRLFLTGKLWDTTFEVDVL